MKVTLTANGKEVELELTQEQVEQLGVVEKKKAKTGYDRESFFYKDNGDGVSVCGSLDCMGACDDNYYNTGNYYSSEKVAIANARADALLRKIRRYAAEHGGIPKKDEDGYYIRYGSERSLLPFQFRYAKMFGAHGVVFRERDACLSCIEEFKEDLIWYFDAYEPMLYDEATV